jgi:hypothetical protein
MLIKEMRELKVYVLCSLVLSAVDLTRAIGKYKNFIARYAVKKFVSYKQANFGNSLK